MIIKKYKDFINESSNDDFVLLYHGSSKENEENLLKNGWQPNKVLSGSNQGNPNYLYLALSPESACYYAACKDNDKNVLEVRIPKSYLKVDPHDGMYHGNVDMELEHGVSLVCFKKLPSWAFNKYTGDFKVTGCDDFFDDYD